MTVELKQLDPEVGGWFSERGSFDRDYCRRENHIDVPAGEICPGCFFPIDETSVGFAISSTDGWTFWHSACYYDKLTESRAAGLVETELDGESFETW